MEHNLGKYIIWLRSSARKMTHRFYIHGTQAHAPLLTCWHRSVTGRTELHANLCTRLISMEQFRLCAHDGAAVTEQ